MSGQILKGRDTLYEPVAPEPIHSYDLVPAHGRVDRTKNAPVRDRGEK